MQRLGRELAFDGIPVAALRRDGDRLVAYATESGVAAYSDAGEVRWFHRTCDYVDAAPRLVDGGARVLARNQLALDILDAASGRLVATIDRPSTPVASPRSRHVAVDGRIIDARSGQLVVDLRREGLAIAALSTTRAIARRGSELVLLDGIGDHVAMRCWSADEIGRASALHLSTAGHLVYAAGFLAINVFDAETGRELDRIITTGSELRAIAIDPEDTQVVTADRNERVALYTRDGALVWRCDGPWQAPVTVELDAHVTVLDRTMRVVLDRATGAQLATGPRAARDLVWTRRVLARELRVDDRLILGALEVVPHIPHASVALDDGVVARVLDTERVELSRDDRIISTWNVAGDHASMPPLLVRDGATLRAWRNCFADEDEYHQVYTLAIDAIANPPEETEPEHRADWLLADEPPRSLRQRGSLLELAGGNTLELPRPASCAVFCGAAIVVGCSDGSVLLVRE